MESSQTARLSSIFIYPIKSCRGIEVSQAPLTPVGFRWDRNWLIVNSNGRAYTQRVEPKLALVTTHLPIEAFSLSWQPSKDSSMVISAPGMSALKIPLTTSREVAHGVSVWEWSGSALDEGQQAADWFTSYIGKPSRLVRFNAASNKRVVDPNYAQDHAVFFADMFPYLLISQGSLDALNGLLNDPVPINRFRPNLLVDGCEPFAEDLWREFRLGSYKFEGVKLCSRCKVPSIDQETGVAGPEPTVSLNGFRSGQVLRPTKSHKEKVYFGQNVVWSDKIDGGSGSILRVGDPAFVDKKFSSVGEAAA